MIKFLLCLTLLLSAVSARAADCVADIVGSHVCEQSKIATQSSTATWALAFDSDVTAGSLGVLGFGVNNLAAVILSVSDNQGNTWLVGCAALAGPVSQMKSYYAPNMAAGATTVTVVFDDAYSGRQGIGEISGADTVAPLDGPCKYGVGSGTSITSDTLTTTVANDILIVFGYCIEDVTTAGTGFTMRSSVGPLGMEDRTAATPGGYTASMNSFNGDNLIQLMAFKPASAGAAPRRAPVIF